MYTNDYDMYSHILRLSELTRSMSESFNNLAAVVGSPNHYNQIVDSFNALTNSLKPLYAIEDILNASTFDAQIQRFAESVAQSINQIDLESLTAPLLDFSSTISEIMSDYPEISEPSEAEQFAEECEPACDSVMESLPQEPLTFISEYRSSTPISKLLLIVSILTLIFGIPGCLKSTVDLVAPQQPAVINNYTVNITVNSDESETDTDSDNHEPDNDMRERIEN